MRSSLGALAVSCWLAACASPSESGKHRSDVGDANAASGAGARASTESTATALSCPTGVPAARTLVANVNAADVRLAAGSIWFRTDTGVDRIQKDGTGKVEVVSSRLVARSYVDESAIITIEAPEDENDADPVSVIRAFSLDGKETFNTMQPWAPASVQFVGSDSDAFYVQTTDAEGQDSVQRIDRTAGNATELVTFGSGVEDIISDPQVVGAELWVVRGGKRVVKVRIAAADADGNFAPTTPEPPQELFGSTQTCRLAVAADAIYCSDGKQITRRDLAGANATTIFDLATDPTPVAVGAPTFVQGSLVTMPGSDQQTSPLKAVIRTMNAAATAKADAKVLACGRGTVTQLAADAVSVTWAEIGTSKGLYIAAR